MRFWTFSLWERFFLHSFVSWAASTFGDIPSYVIEGTFSLAGFTVQAIGWVCRLERAMNIFVNTCRTEGDTRWVKLGDAFFFQHTLHCFYSIFIYIGIHLGLKKANTTKESINFSFIDYRNIYWLHCLFNFNAASICGPRLLFTWHFLLTLHFTIDIYCF